MDANSVAGRINHNVANVLRIIPPALGSSYRKAANGANTIAGRNMIR